jgi:hypothetical protein
MDLIKRQMLFMLVCLPLRFILSVIPLFLNKYLKHLYAVVVFIIGMSYLYFYFLNKRLIIGAFNQKIWWKDIRLINGMLYITAAIYLFNNNNLASIMLLLEVFIALLFYLNIHFF